MTFYQLLMYLTDETKLGGTRSMGIGEAISHRAQIGKKNKPIRYFSNEHPNGILLAE